LGVKAGQPFAEPRRAVEYKAEISADQARIARQRFLDALQASRREDAVGMQEQQDIAARPQRAGAKLAPASGPSMECIDPMLERYLECAVTAPAIDDDDLMFR
jgi:hypothetical protein